jgi:hypothetical protein
MSTTTRFLPKHRLAEGVVGGEEEQEEEEGPPGILGKPYMYIHVYIGGKDISQTNHGGNLIPTGYLKGTG